MTNPVFYGVPNNVSPLLFYPPSRVPFESADNINQNVDAINNNRTYLNELVNDIISHRKKYNKREIPRMEIEKHLMKSAGAGFFDDLYSGLKSVVSSVGNSALKGVDNIISNPTSALEAIAPLAPLLMA